MLRSQTVHRKKPPKPVMSITYIDEEFKGQGLLFLAFEDV